VDKKAKIDKCIEGRQISGWNDHSSMTTLDRTSQVMVAPDRGTHL